MCFEEDISIAASALYYYNTSLMLMYIHSNVHIYIFEVYTLIMSSI